ncbi:MAG: biotin/lipoyl-binding protein [Polyangiaceae bacterium]|nr:biotin/lipoyl-binding protein [Polyangiaceae bacterium]
MITLRQITAALHGAAPALTMGITLGLAAYLHFGGDQRGRVVGFAQATTEAISPTEIARVASVTVAVGDVVIAGQVVATLDTSGLDAEIAVAEAEKARLDASVRAERALLEQRPTVGVEALQRELAREREEQLRVRAEEQALQGERARVRRLVDERQAILDDLTRLDLQHASVKAIADQKPRTIGLLESQIAAAKQRHKEAVTPAASPAELDADLLLARRTIDLLEQRRAGYVLRATHAGRVAGIDKQPGEVAAAGEPILRLVSAQNRVIVCVPERAALGLREGDGARLWVQGQGGSPLAGKALALGPLVTELPIRCRAAPSIPAWGREVTVALDHPVDLVPGQAFDVVFDSSSGAPSAAPAGESIAAAAPPPAPPAPAGPGIMIVPPALLQRTRFEPSGLLARPSERRYLIASDDTGRDGDEHEPWLFAMTPGGAVDPQPVPLTGVDKIDDVEALAAGDAGEIYLLSSQSYSRKGKRKPARTALLRLRPDGSGFRADGEVHLAELIDAAGAPIATALGLQEGTRPLDIEGLAFRGGALFVGLKAPLDDKDNAMIWRIATPRALFDGARARSDPKRLEDAGLSLWARVRVDVEIGGQPVPGGISDLCFFPGGDLAIASTPSTADGEAGALWRVDHGPIEGAAPPNPPPSEARSLAPRLVRRFPGLKPEGLAPSLTPGKLMVVFDAGSATPSFEELPWDG